MAITIDAHQHFWQLGKFDYGWLNAPPLAKIRRDFLPEHLQSLLAANGIDRSIFVQTQHNMAENDWVLSLAEQHDFIAGVVGWIDLASHECESQIEKYAACTKFVGVRHVVQDEPDDDFVIRPDFLQGLASLERAGIPFDMLFFVEHLKHASTLAEKFPNLTLVLNHLAKPVIKHQELEPWRTDFRRAASYPNVVCKLSGMVTEADWQHWKPADLQPYVNEALEAFGPKRLLYGSDWPVCELAASYEQTVNALRGCLSSLSSTEQAAIFGENAQRVYRLK